MATRIRNILLISVLQRFACKIVFIIRSLTVPLIPGPMIWNYLKYAFRNLLKQRGRTVINMLGLSFGIACVVIIYRAARQNPVNALRHE
jgi:hypothetical protein